LTAFTISSAAILSEPRPDASASSSPTELLRVSGLKTHFFTRHGVARSVDGVDFRLDTGEHLGLIGESGSGKSVTALSIMRLIREPPGKIVAGEIHFEGRNLLALDAEEMRKLRGSRISMIFQDPLNHLDPVMKVGDWIAEALTLHKGMNRREALAAAARVLKVLKVASPEDVLGAYPFQLSGGMCQRILIATAIVTEPALIIADEATSALDVTVQASILRSLTDLTDLFGTAILLTTHNMLVVRKACSRVMVMYAGRVVESCATATLFRRPMHPYTVGLLNSVPALERVGQPLVPMGGEPPLPTDHIPGCAFYARCTRRQDRCLAERPLIREVEPDHWSACHFAEDVSSKTSS
jgi:peptide/nickel transport system ATP-binding protein